MSLRLARMSLRLIPMLLPFCVTPALAAGEPQVLVHSQVEVSARAPHQFSIEIEGLTLELELAPNESLLAGLPKARQETLAAEGQRFLQGRIKGVENSWARISVIDGNFSGAWFDGRELFLLDPVASMRSQLAQPAEAAGHIAYRLRDIEFAGPVDEVVHAPDAAAKHGPQRFDYAGFGAHLRQSATALPDLRAPVRQLRLTVVTDTEFSSVHGGNRDAVVASRLNTVDGIYSDQFQTRIVLGQLTHLADNGTLNTTVVSGSDTLLSRFRGYMNSGAGSSIPKGGLNHLFSGKDFDGSTVGVAYVGVLCSTSNGYGINQVRAANNTTALTIAHEMGHNFGASHDGQTGSVCASQSGSWLMSPSLNGSSTFSPCSRTSIEPRIASATCFQPVTVSGVVFTNGFEN
jgi:hypothetical protein